ncbi:hypothetical protein F6B77_23000, partial [Salmonella enterica]|nr:hypothetical protein [Salmonella enterica]
TGFVLGLLLISCLNPEGRHIFWATCILKISVFATIFKIFKSNIKNNAYTYSLTIAMAICMSAIAPVLYTTKAKPFSYNKSNMNSEINKKIISIVKSTGITYIYGEDFWRMQLLNSIDAEVHSSELTDAYDKFVIPRTWLSRPSW